jgi:hypothetical protein
LEIREVLVDLLQKAGARTNNSLLACISSLVNVRAILPRWNGRVATLKRLRNAGHENLQLTPWQTQAGKRLSNASKNEVYPLEEEK